MKKRHIPAIALALLISLSTLAGCNNSTPKVMETKSGELSEELTHHAYDTIFILSFATLGAETGENDVVLTEEGGTKTYQFSDFGYLDDDAEALANGTMKSISGDSQDQSEVDMTFKNDPKNLKSITIQSSGLPGQTHNEGKILINGVEKPFLEFVEYFAAKFQREMNSGASSEASPES